MVHLATEQGLPVIGAFARAGTNITAETCVHYLTFSSEEIDDGETAFKCAPPIRGADTREALWRALGDGRLGFVTTDHSPSPADLKSTDTGRFDEAWGGIASVQLFLSALWTGAHARGYSLDRVAQWACFAPAEFAGLAARKGEVAVGKDADLIIFDPDAEWLVHGEDLQHRHDLTPYDGRTLRGVVHRTYLRGELAYVDGKHGPPAGIPLLRSEL